MFLAFSLWSLHICSFCQGQAHSTPLNAALRSALDSANAASNPQYLARNMARKEVITLISTVTSVDTVITDVEEIEVKPIEEQGQRVARTIVIRTAHKEIYTLELYADSSLNLNLVRDAKDRGEDWLTPKVYKGKSMTELGENYEE
jgi:hypothetical protein